MSCFSGLIQLKGCSVTEVPGSVYSLNSLPGISLNTFENVANSEQKNYVGVWDNINECAEARIKNEIISNLSTRYHINRVRRTTDTAYNVNTDYTATRKYTGIFISVAYSLTNNWMPSPFAMISFDKIRFYVKDNTIEDQVTIEIANWLTKDILWSKTVALNTLNEGWNEISVNKSWNHPSLIVGYSCTWDTLSYSSTYSNEWFEDGCSYCFGDTCGYIKGFNSNTDSISGVLQTNSTIVGLQAVVTTGCAYDAAMCTNRLLFAEAFWYLLGSELMTEVMFSERINFWTSIKREQAEELKALYDIRYEEALKNALSGMNFSCDSCLECDSQVQQFSQTP